MIKNTRFGEYDCVILYTKHETYHYHHYHRLIFQYRNTYYYFPLQRGGLTLNIPCMMSFARYVILTTQNSTRLLVSTSMTMTGLATYHIHTKHIIIIIIIILRLLSPTGRAQLIIPCYYHIGSILKKKKKMKF